MRTIFSKEEVVILRQNPCVFSCTEKLVNYTYEFKKQALELHKQGVTAREVWRRSGFDTNKWRRNYFGETIRDWRKIVERDGLEGLLRHPSRTPCACAQG